MKKFFIVIGLVFLSCNSPLPEPRSPLILKPISNQSLAKGILYEVNIRQYSREGTFEAFRNDLPKIKELGVNICLLYTSPSSRD